MQVPKLSKTSDNFWIYNIKREVIFQKAKLWKYVFTLSRKLPEQLPGKEFQQETQNSSKSTTSSFLKNNFTFDVVNPKVINSFL